MEYDIESILEMYEDDYNPSSMVPGPRNMANGGQIIGKPGGVVEPGVMYYGKTKKISNTKGLEKLVKQDKITNKNVQNWTTKWIKQNAKKYNIRQFDKFLSLIHI